MKRTDIHEGDHLAYAPAPTTFEEAMQQSFDRKVAGVADDLRRMADSVEREATRRSNDGEDRHHRVTRSIIHEVTWGVANLGLGHLYAHALDIDDARKAAAAQTVTAPDTDDLGPCPTYPGDV